MVAILYSSLNIGSMHQFYQFYSYFIDAILFNSFCKIFLNLLDEAVIVNF